MPLTRVEIEETGPNRFVAEVEQGGYASARRTNVRGGSRAEIIARVAEQLGCAEEVIRCLDGIVRERAEPEEVQGETLVECQADPAPVQGSDTPLANEGGPQAEEPAPGSEPAPQADTSGTVEGGPTPPTEDSTKTLPPVPPGARVGKGGVVYERVQKAQ